jgi:hypothetical protein
LKKRKIEIPEDLNKNKKEIKSFTENSAKEVFKCDSNDCN